MGIRIIRILVFILFPSIVFGQTLHLSTSKQTSDNNTSTFLLGNGEVTISNNSLQFSSNNNAITDFEDFGVSPDKSIIGVLKRSEGQGEIILFNSLGDTLNSYTGKSLASDDPSQAVYPLNNSNVIFRDNITYFTLYDTFGETLTGISSSSESEEGETIAEVVMSKDGQTMVVYNPKVKRKGNLGSKAQVMLPDKTFQNIYFSTDRYLKEVRVSEDGNFVIAITAQEGANDRVLIMDKYGNELNDISTDENLLGISLSDDSEYITLFSSGRVMVYSVLDGERLGATSIRSSVFLADYFPEDNIILVLMGNYSASTGTMNNVEFRAINIGQRAIAGEEFSGVLGFSEAITPEFVRFSSNNYQLKGGSKRINITANF